MQLRMLLVTAVACFGLVTSEATACFNGIELEVNPKVLALQNAEAAMRVREFRRAGNFAVSAFPAWRKIAPGKSLLEQRAVRVLAMVVTRSGGTWHERGILQDPEAVKQNLQFALRQLRLRAIGKPNDPARVTDLGEALERVGESIEAWHVLETLAKSNSITSAEGWAALARLRSAAGDESGRRQAETMCQTMTTKSRICLTGSQA